MCTAILCSQGVCAQPRKMGIEELFRLADGQSVSIQACRTAAEAAGEALKAARAQRLPDIGVSLSASYLGNGRHFPLPPVPSVRYPGAKGPETDAALAEDKEIHAGKPLERIFEKFQNCF